MKTNVPARKNLAMALSVCWRFGCFRAKIVKFTFGFAFQQTLLHYNFPTSVFGLAFQQTFQNSNFQILIFGFTFYQTW